MRGKIFAWDLSSRFFGRKKCIFANLPLKKISRGLIFANFQKIRVIRESFSSQKFVPLKYVKFSREQLVAGVNFHWSEGSRE